MKSLKTYAKELKKHEFRVAIFGSARIRTNDKIYQQVFNLAKSIGEKGYDVVTGGGPGLMEAANVGHSAGDPSRLADNIGLPIELPWESEANKHLELKRHFNKFSKRLDNFMALSSVAIIMPGGIGTCLELFYVWQLIQVRHVKPIPIILIGKMWEELIEWIKQYPLKKGLISAHDLDNIHIVKSTSAAMRIINKAHLEFTQNHAHDNNGYLNNKKRK